MGSLNELPVKQAVGETQTCIAKQIGVDQSTISRFTNKDEAKKLIEEEQLELIEWLPDAVQNVKNLVEEVKGLPNGMIFKDVNYITR